MLVVVLFFLAHTVGVTTSHTRRVGKGVEALFWITIITVYYSISLGKPTLVTLILGMNRH